MPRPAAARAGAVLALASVLVSACAPRPTPAERPAPDPAVARVGGETLHLSDVERAAHARDPASAGRPLDRASPLYAQSLQAAVDQRLLALEAERLHLERDARVKRRLAAARDKVLADAALDHEIEEQVGEPALRALYDEQRRQAKPGFEVDAAQIVVGSEAQAQAVKAQLAAGADFAALAQARSSDAATRFAGGELGWIAPSALPGAYGAALAAAAPGDLVGPLRLPEGWVVARLEGRRPAQPLPYEAARPQLLRFLAYDRLQSLLQRLRSRSEVTLIRPPVPPAPSAGARRR